MSVGVIGNPSIFEALKPLLNLYRQKYGLILWDSNGLIPNENELLDFANRNEAILLVGNRRRAPRTVLSAPIIKNDNSKLIPLSWLPNVSHDALRCFAQAAVKVHERGAIKKSTVALLGQWQPRFLNLTDRIEYLLKKGVTTIDIKRWTADYLVREDLMKNLQQGLGLSIYVGHGRAIGWVGYHGTRIHHFPLKNPQPIGAMLSLSCVTASRKRTGLSFAEALPLRGMCASSFGAVVETYHTDNARWSMNICNTLVKGVPHSIGELIVNSLPSSHEAITPYRLMGDPMAPLFDATENIEDFSQIKELNYVTT